MWHIITRQSTQIFSSVYSLTSCADFKVENLHLSNWYSFVHKQFRNLFLKWLSFWSRWMLWCHNLNQSEAPNKFKVDWSSNLEDVKKTDLHTADRFLPHNPPTPYPTPSVSGVMICILCTWNKKINPKISIALKSNIVKSLRPFQIWQVCTCNNNCSCKFKKIFHQRNSLKQHKIMPHHSLSIYKY